MYQERTICERARLVSSTEPVGSSAHRRADVPRRCQAPDGAAGSESPMAQLVVNKIMIDGANDLNFRFSSRSKNLLRIRDVYKNGHNKSEPCIAN